jgi:hypothetical protein
MRLLELVGGTGSLGWVAIKAVLIFAVAVIGLRLGERRTLAHGLTFPVGFGADARAVADLTGAFVNSDPVYLQSTGFVLDPAGKVVVSVYSSGAIGRSSQTTSPSWCATYASTPRLRRYPAGRQLAGHPKPLLPRDLRRTSSGQISHECRPVRMAS